MTRSPRHSTPPAALVAAALLAIVAGAAPLRAQTTTGPAVAHEIKVTLHRAEEPGWCGGIVDWREQLTGWVGMPGTRIARNAANSYPSAADRSAYTGVLWRTVHASVCQGKCPDGACSDVCNFTIEATGPAELMLMAEDEGARLGIHKNPKYTVLRYGGGTCPGMHDDDQVFRLFDSYFVPDLGFLPGDVSVKQLQTGLSLPVMADLGDEERGTLEVLAGCNDKTFNPSPGVGCGTPKAKKPGRKAP